MKLIYDMTFENLQKYLENLGCKKYRCSQIWDWLYIKKVNSFDEMTNLPPELISSLKQDFQFMSLDLVLQSTSLDGTIKFLFGLHDKNLIEVVLMNHHYGLSLCVTSQIGCNIGCSFCASGRLSKKRDLTSGEIVLQILEVEKILDKKITSVVVMGIGEPFDNFDNLIDFLSIINHQKGLNIGARRITVSTAGIIPGIMKFADLKLQVNLALSLHSAIDSKRTSLMKINQAYKLANVMESIKYYLDKTNRRVTIEYILIDQVNDQKEDALALIKLLKGLNVYINLIPYNEVIEAPYKRSSKENQLKFLDIVKKGGLDVTLRKEQGHDINAACGQLRSVQEAKREKMSDN